MEISSIMMQHHENYPAETWEYIAIPEDVGWSTKPSGVAKAFSDIVGFAAVLIITGGKILVEWGDIARRFFLQHGLGLAMDICGVAVDGSMCPGVTLPEGCFAALGMGGHFVINTVPTNHDAQYLYDNASPQTR